MENELVFVKAGERDFYSVTKHYDKVVKGLESGVNYPGWKSDIYPTTETAKSQIEKDQLFLALSGSDIAGSVAITHTAEDGYQNVDFALDCSYDQLFVLRTLAVSPDYLRHGVGKFLIESCIQKARQESIRAIRLDVSPANTPAQILYEKCGFKCVGTTDINYVDVILSDFKLYELII